MRKQFLQYENERKNYIFKFAVVFFGISLMFLSTAYSLYMQNLNIQVKANIAGSSSADEEVQFNISDTWYSDFRYYYNVELIINNTNSIQSNAWEVSFSVPSDVESVECWNANSQLISNGRIKLTSLDYNSIIMPGGSITLGFIIGTSLDSDYVPTNIDVNVITLEDLLPDIGNDPVISEDDINAEIIMTNSWLNNGKYSAQYTLTITNDSDIDISSWRVRLKDASLFIVDNMWGAEYSVNESVLEIYNTYYNGTVKSKESVQINFQLTSKYSGYTPNVTFSGIVKDEQNDMDVDFKNLDVNFTSYNKERVENEYLIYYDVNVSNKTGTDISSWKIEIDDATNFILDNVSGADYILTDNVLSITSINNSGIIQNNGITTFRLSLKSSDENYIPNVSYKISS